MNEKVKTGSNAEVEQESHASTEARPESGYWCVVCGREIPLQDGLYIHDDIPGHEVLSFDEEERPQ